MPVDKRPNAEPIRGYRLIERLGSGGFGEVWKCEAPGGIFKAVKFVYGNLNGLDVGSARAEEELRAVQRIKSIRHPFLLSMDRVESVSGELVIVTELADHNLFELWERYQQRGLPGVPRDELLGYLREAAEVLDLLNEKFDLQHLDIKPHNLFVVSNHVKVADFGLVNSLAGGDLQVQMGAVTPLYAAPELFHGKLSRHCDQYSLAIVYQELLTGVLPLQGKNMRQLLVQHTQMEPNLQALPAPDRPLVARALAKMPEQRYPSCLDFVRALKGESPIVIQAAPAAAESAPAPAASVTETVSLQGKDTEKLQTPATPRLAPGVLSDEKFLGRVSMSPFMEVWKSQSPAGLKRLVQILYGSGGTDPKRLKEALTRLCSLAHPALLAPTIAHVEPGRLVFITDLFKETLRDRFQQCQARKQPGIVRGELVDYLRAAAEVLDYLYAQHNVQHLNLNPRNLVLDNGWLQLAEFGYAHILWLPDGQDVAQRNVRYAAPELFERTLSRGCDQYSLALIYAEMLTGIHPFRGQNPLTCRRKNLAPDLERLQETDRAVIARALHPNPEERWPSCTDMLLALEGTTPELHQELQEKPDYFTKLVETERHAPTQLEIKLDASSADLNRIISDLVHGAGGPDDASAPAPAELFSDEEVLRHQFQVGVPLGTARGKLDAFRREVFAQLVGESDQGCLFGIAVPGRFWQRWLGHQPALHIDIKLARVNPMSATPIEVKTEMRAVSCGRRRALELLERMGPALLENLQKHLLISSEKRMQDRLLWPHPLTVIPIQANGERDDPIECRGKDISHTGIGFYLPHDLHTSQVLIELPNTLMPPCVTIPATLVRAKRCADGWYEVGALFHLTPLRCSHVELSVANKG
jgi:serine/threonine protein kinase